MEYSNLIDKAINKKFKRPLNNSLKHNIGKLSNDKKAKHLETINLLEQAFNLINNSEQLLKKGDIVASCVLLRSAFEYMMLGVNIQFNEKVYNEMINLSITFKDRDNTLPSRLITEYRTHLNELSNYELKLINREEKKAMLAELYDKLCLFTHGSLFVSALSNARKGKVKQVYLLLAKVNVFILKYLLLINLKYFNGDKTSNLEYGNIYLSYLFTIIKINNIANECKDDIKDLNKYLYLDKNEEYLEKCMKEANNIKDILNEQVDDINDNKDEFQVMLKEFFS